jgi:hypothetical protein
MGGSRRGLSGDPVGHADPAAGWATLGAPRICAMKCYVLQRADLIDQEAPLLPKLVILCCTILQKLTKECEHAIFVAHQQFEDRMVLAWIGNKDLEHVERLVPAVTRRVDQDDAHHGVTLALLNSTGRLGSGYWTSKAGVRHSLDGGGAIQQQGHHQLQVPDIRDEPAHTGHATATAGLVRTL